MNAHCINKYLLSTYYVLGTGNIFINWIVCLYQGPLTGKRETKFSYRCHAVIKTVGNIKGHLTQVFGGREGFLKEKTQ